MHLHLDPETHNIVTMNTTATATPICINIDKHYLTDSQYYSVVYTTMYTTVYTTVHTVVYTKVYTTVYRCMFQK